MKNDKDFNRPRTDRKVHKADLDAMVNALEDHLRAIDRGAGKDRSIDAVRVARVKRAVAERRYRIDPDATADELLKALSDLLRAHRR